MSKMAFYSTNGKSPRISVSLAEALITGQAPDKGLYMPETIPTLSKMEIDRLRGKSYPEVAAYILNKYCEGTFSPELIAELS